ncbi:MAG: hypothetical protein O3B01_31515, partial [Planctomycetota bacterium]|nr:hypothetical protein [Planctomycetota bacterium]
IRVSGDTIIVTLYNAEELEHARTHYENLWCSREKMWAKSRATPCSLPTFFLKCFGFEWSADIEET